MDAIVQAAREEERRLLALLDANPLYRKLQAVRHVISEYGEAPGILDKLIAASTENIKATVSAQTQVGVSRNVAGQVRAWVIPYLRAHGQRVQSNDLAELAQKEGIVIGGKNAVATMSSYLSGMPELNNVRGQGYGLREWTERKPHLEARMAKPLTAEHEAMVDQAIDWNEEAEQLERDEAEQRNTETAEKVSGQTPSAASVEAGTIME